MNLLNLLAAHDIEFTVDCVTYMPAVLSNGSTYIEIEWKLIRCADDDRYILGMLLSILRNVRCQAVKNVLTDPFWT